MYSGRSIIAIANCNCSKVRLAVGTCYKDVWKSPKQFSKYVLAHFRHWFGLVEHPVAMTGKQVSSREALKFGTFTFLQSWLRENSLNIYLFIYTLHVGCLRAPGEKRMHILRYFILSLINVKRLASMLHSTLWSQLRYKVMLCRICLNSTKHQIIEILLQV